MRWPWYAWWVGVVLAASAGVFIARQNAPRNITIPAAAEPAASRPAPSPAPPVVAIAAAGRQVSH